VHATFEHIKRLRDYGVEFESYTEPHFRTTGPAGELMIAVAAWIAKQERIRLSERTRAGIHRVRRAGTRWGRPKKIIDRERVRALAAQGWGLRKIAAEMNSKVEGGCSHVLIARILKQPAA
jgi:DNA invertase Pin-like site-specific DNA recombinase